MEKKINWLDDARIGVRFEGSEVLISANRDGLLSLADQLTALAEELPGTATITVKTLDGSGKKATTKIVLKKPTPEP